MILFLTALLLSACMARQQSDCVNQICTEEFRTISVTYLDPQDQPVVVTDFRVINQRTGNRIKSGAEADTLYHKGSYVVASDANRIELSEQGDKLAIYAMYKGRAFRSEMVVRGGECACHIEQVSGATAIRVE